jgi:hypothetical protein
MKAVLQYIVFMTSLPLTFLSLVLCDCTSAADVFSTVDQGCLVNVAYEIGEFGTDDLVW